MNVIIAIQKYRYDRKRKNYIGCLNNVMINDLSNIISEYDRTFKSYHVYEIELKILMLDTYFIKLVNEIFINLIFIFITFVSLLLACIYGGQDDNYHINIITAFIISFLFANNCNIIEKFVKAYKKFPSIYFNYKNDTKFCLFYFFL